MAEKKTPAAEAADQDYAPVATATAPTAHAVAFSPRLGRGILIGTAAAALVVGLAVGGAGGFAIANATHRAPVLAQQGSPNQGGMGQQQGPGGPPPQGGQHGHGGGQNGPGQGQQDQQPEQRNSTQRDDSGDQDD